MHSVGALDYAAESACPGAMLKSACWKAIQGILVMAYYLWHISYGILVMAYQLWHISYGILVMAEIAMLESNSRHISHGILLIAY